MKTEKKDKKELLQEKTEKPSKKSSYSKKKKVKDFKNAFDKVLKKKKIPVISEIKKKSPSQGKINKSFSPVKIAKNYQKNGAVCLSVLTDEKYFSYYSRKRKL